MTGTGFLGVVFKGYRYSNIPKVKTHDNWKKIKAELTSPTDCNKISLWISDICNHCQNVGHTMAKLLRKFQSTVLVTSQLFHYLPIKKA